MSTKEAELSPLNSDKHTSRRTPPGPALSLGASRSPRPRPASSSRSNSSISSPDDSSDTESSIGTPSDDSEPEGIPKKRSRRKEVWKLAVAGAILMGIAALGAGSWWYALKVELTSSSSDTASSEVYKSYSESATYAGNLSPTESTNASAIPTAPASTMTVTATSISLISPSISTLPYISASLSVSLPHSSASASSKILTPSSTTSSTAAVATATDVVKGPVINEDFADPGLILPGGAGTWYAYSTSSSHGNVPYATSDNWTNWTIKGDALPSSGSWVDPKNSGIWAPDVRQISGTYVMYYVGYSSSDSNHCIGAATATSPKGPFQPQASPIICNSEDGGVIDASGFEDAGGALYVLWKVDGNSLGKSTPIYIQPVAADGFTRQGSATQLLANDAADGGVTEAPSLVLWNDWYYLFFSSNNYDTLYYDVSYATAKSVTGPYTKSSTPLLQSGKCGTAGPGGATVLNINNDYVNAVIHSDIGSNNADKGRAMWQIASLSLKDGVASIKC